jgi:Fe-S cluster assembly protein SufD
MTVAVMRTKAEQAFSETFEAVAAKLPGGPEVSDTRKEAIGAFAGLGLPHRRVEEWKYTDLRSSLKQALLPAFGDAPPVLAKDIDAALEALGEIDAHRVVFVNGAYRPELSAPAGVRGLEVTSLGQALRKAGTPVSLRATPVPGQEAIIALNTAFVTDGAVVHVAKDAQIEKPLLLVFARAGRDARLLTTRNLITVGNGARATVIEIHVALPGAADGQANAISEIKAGAGADATHIKVTLDGASTSHLAGWVIELAAGSTYRAFQLTAGTGLVRNHLLATFKGKDAKLDISGCFLGRRSEHIDTTLVVDHAVPGCESRELFKGVLADRARGVFQGKVIVRPNAQKTDGKQMAQALMLSEEAEFDSKPELEIYADDVVCGHGSTAAEIDKDLLFYLRSRGIPPNEARAMLIESFVREALEKVEKERLREALSAIAVHRLEGLSAAQDGGS